MRAVEGAMRKASLWNKSVSRVEFDRRAREARLQLERAERLLAPHARASQFWLRRMLLRFGSFGNGSRGDRTGIPSSQRRGQTPHVNQARFAAEDRFCRIPGFSLNHRATG
jgi:hypothetical protein